jgi:hypothetical protein
VVLHEDLIQLLMLSMAVAFEQTQSHPFEDVQEEPDQLLTQLLHAHDGVANAAEVKRAVAAMMEDFILTVCLMLRCFGLRLTRR